MDARRARHAVSEVERVCRTATDPTALHRSVTAAVAGAVPHDRWCAMSFDPATALPTGGFHEEGLPPALLPRLLELEFGGGPDVGRLAELARAERSVVRLSEATGRAPQRSARFRDVLEPAGLPHEVRAVHRDGRTPWGALILLRGSDVADFTAAEAALVGSIGSHVAEALRRVQLLARAGEGGDDGPGVVLLDVGARRVAVISGSPAALQRLGDVDDGTAEGLPHVVTSLVRTAAGGPGRARCRLRSRTGRWLTLHAERLSGSTVSLVVEPSRPADIAALLIDAYRLTERETEVVGLVVRGYSNAEIAGALWLSPHTVADHVKHVFEKTGVHSRVELTSRLFFDHYLPRG
ncbi:helix-turn-helix transcriptional regulator [Geodermatophilus sp. YIM 151500]|uniref:helix-turn-helix transcriptional regulator n=1 Tax=Geodermatophilus sp. YIM 151500 TaxID=2984531 RepID=UPI0021E3E9CA|nr:helix-turn-helix transcriptional regulator [Geodermatophilus sp. YIM 151500]MCV2490636.1 helix-turn-helix transcriptional regulator [Geodermatophilus sp. YIM 151500]